jgi:hypothetical protein
LDGIVKAMVRKPKKGTSAAAGKNQGGRPELNADEKRETLVRVLVNVAEYRQLQEAAAYAGHPMSAWLRGVGLEKARALAAEKEAARARDK